MSLTFIDDLLSLREVWFNPPAHDHLCWRISAQVFLVDLLMADSYLSCRKTDNHMIKRMSLRMSAKVWAPCDVFTPCSSQVSVSVSPPAVLSVSPSSAAVPPASFCAPPADSHADVELFPPSPTTELSWPLRGWEKSDDAVSHSLYRDALLLLMWLKWF